MAQKQDPDYPADEHQTPDRDPGLEKTDAPDGYLTGGRLIWLTIGLYLGVFLAQLEMTVVSTALVTITSDLNDFGNSTWIINAYLLTWSGFLVLWAQFSHSIGRKTSLAAALVLFTLFSAACSAAQTSTQLIVLRAFQGLAGAGVFNVAMVIMAEAVDPKDFPKFVALLSIVAALAFAVGPLIGGAIATRTTWRWVFIFNVPASLVALLVDMIALPSGFPHQHRKQATEKRSVLATLGMLDYGGALLFLCSSIFLVTALQEVQIFYPWDSALVISFLVISGVALIVFCGWEYMVTLKKTHITPILTWKFADRRCLGLFISSFLIGVPFTSTLVQIPQRLQVVNGFSAYDAGVRLIPYVIMIPFGAIVGSVLLGKFKLPAYGGFLLGSVLQLIAVVCFATIEVYPSAMIVPAKTYAFQIILGFGSGISNAVSTNSVPFIVRGNKALIAPGLGANNQFRFLGGAVGLGVVTCVLNGNLRPQLTGLLPDDLLTEVLQSAEAIKALPTGLQQQVLDVFADAFLLQWKALCAFVGLQVLAGFLTI